ncbi:MAG: hypothetical protein AAB410_02730 [Patescibacteria group bacterium]
MRSLTEKQLARQDEVDNAVFDLINKLNPVKKEIGWHIEFIGEVRDKIETILTSDLRVCNKQNFYPSKAIKK